MTAWPLSPRRGRAIRDGAIAAGLLFLGYLFIVAAPAIRTFGYDAFAYWSVDPAHPYPAGVDLGALGFFPYSPALAQLFSLGGHVPWTTFLVLWTAVLVGTVIWLGGRWTLALLAFPPVALELYHGNVHLLIAASIVLGFRHPWAWSFAILTKVTPGVGLLWFAVRREWRSLAIALGATVIVAAVSFALAPATWGEWLRTLVASSAVPVSVSVPVPLLVRVPIAAAVVVWGARTDRPWTVPVASTIALPVLWIAGLSMLVAVVPLVRWRRGGGEAPAASLGTRDERVAPVLAAS